MRAHLFPYRWQTMVAVVIEPNPSRAKSGGGILVVQQSLYIQDKDRKNNPFSRQELSESRIHRRGHTNVNTAPPHGRGESRNPGPSKKEPKTISKMNALLLKRSAQFHKLKLFLTVRIFLLFTDTFTIHVILNSHKVKHVKRALSWNYSITLKT